MIEFDFHLRPERREQKLANGPKPDAPKGRIPRVARLMALAIRMDELVRLGQVRDYAELAKLGHVSRARVTQIMNLLNLAPDIQEEILFLPTVERGRDSVGERDLRRVVAEVDWERQREAWKTKALE